MLKEITGDLIKMDVEAIVNAANVGLKGGGGLCGQIHEAAGPQLDAECTAIGSCQRGEAVITKGYNLTAKYIIHTPGPVWGFHEGKEPEILYSCYYESLRLAKDSKIATIAFPYISTGIYRYPKDKAKVVAVEAIKDFIEDFPNSCIREIYLVDYLPTVD